MSVPVSLDAILIPVAVQSASADSAKKPPAEWDEGPEPALQHWYVRHSAPLAAIDAVRQV